MSKEIEDKVCTFCESQYKLSYVAEDVSGFPKFCCFCGEAWEENIDKKDEDYDNSDAGC